MSERKSVATAPGKVILFGEHAVVYGQPAIAVPLHDRQATATVQVAARGEGIALVAADLGRRYPLAEAPGDDSLALIVRCALEVLALPFAPDLMLTIHSTIPIASGLGSGAAVSAAVVRALAAHFGRELTPQRVSELVYQTEVLHHGTPSGIDNTVVAFEEPVYFIKGQPPQCFRVGQSFCLLIGDTGIPSPTKVAVADVRQSWKANRARYGALFEAIGQIADEARRVIESGDIATLGPLMDRNQALLREMGVSSPELEELILAAKGAGALGAKLSGAGRGGNMIALVTQATAERVATALLSVGAKDVIITRVG